LFLKPFFSTIKHYFKMILSISNDICLAPVYGERMIQLSNKKIQYLFPISKTDFFILHYSRGFTCNSRSWFESMVNVNVIGVTCNLSAVVLIPCYWQWVFIFVIKDGIDVWCSTLFLLLLARFLNVLFV
jgi:hypothetical protein